METQSRRRWFQFSIKSLLLLVLLAATFLSGWITHREFARVHEAKERARYHAHYMAEKKRMMVENSKKNAELMSLLTDIKAQIDEHQAQFARMFEKKENLRLR